MKIGILTFYNVANYGAALQAWALSEFLKSHGYEVEFVNHTPEVTADNIRSVVRSSLGSSNLAKMVAKLFLLPINVGLGLIKIGKYRKFVKKYLHENQIKDSIAGYDVIVVGSDQVWNYKLTGGFDEFFWGNANSQGNNPSYVAYAASLNITSFDNEEYVRASLKKFKAISAREKPAVELLSNYTDKKIHFVCDPTCLVSRYAWNKIINEKYIPKEDYLLIYPVGNVEETIRIGKRIAAEKGLKVVHMMSQISLHQDQDSYFFDGPEGFISKLSAAKIVVTSSFHGTILSALFNRDFYSIKHIDESNDRASSLLSNLGIEDRLVSSYEQCLSCCPIDYTVVNQRIDQFRSHSAEFLLNSLKMVE